MATYYYDDTSQSASTATTTNKKQNIPKSIFTNNLNEGQNEMTNSWLMSPLLSPPIHHNKLEHQFYSATFNNTTVEQPAPISTMSTPNRRLSNNHTAPWHSLWTTSSITASPWQNNTACSNDHHFDETASSPIDLDFLEDTPPSFAFNEQEGFSREQRSQSVSAIFPATSNSNTAAVNTSMVDDYFSSKKNKNNRNNSINTTTPIGIHRTRRVSSSIWDFNPLNNNLSAFLPVSSFNSSSSNNSSVQNNCEQERRHSIATMTTAIQQQQHHQQRPNTPPFTTTAVTTAVARVDENYSPLSSTFIDVSILGKGLPLNQLKENQVIYHVQFKVNYRTDYFYYIPSSGQEEETPLQLNDRVIVEADRGYDVGKIIALVEPTKEQQKKKANRGENNMNVVKRIFRRATENELLSFEVKAKDEEKALMICQAKIKQRGLNMEVVEAEYQWDRRKLTFYFKANERVDFRELVRELFKIYKTRIWMCCASNSFTASGASVSSSVSSSTFSV